MEDAKVEDVKVEDAKVEDATVEDATVEDAKVEDDIRAVVSTAEYSQNGWTVRAILTLPWTLRWNQTPQRKLSLDLKRFYLDSRAFEGSIFIDTGTPLLATS